jgi:hypothetical protein
VEEGKKILKQIHTGTCGNHTTSRTLVGKAFLASFYWPSAVADAEALVRRYESCQLFAKQIHAPAQALQMILAPRVENYNKENSNQARLIEVDSLKKERLVSCVRTPKYLDSMRRYYNRNVNDQFFVFEDLVLCKK